MPCKTILLSNFFINNKILEFFISLKYILFNFKKAKLYYKLDRKDGLNKLVSFKNLLMNSKFLNQKLDWLHFGFGTAVFSRENVAEAIGAKMAVSFRGFDIGVYPIKNINCYEKLWQKVDKIHVISDDISDLVFENGFKDKNKIVKITPAINIDFFKIAKDKSINNKLIFTTIARLHWKKGLEYTLEALAILKLKGVDFQYNIIGDGSEKERLQFVAHQLGITNCVRFLGKMKPDEVKEELEKTDIYLQYSIQEGFCNAVLEAQAMGLLCIVSDAEGLSENILDGKTGFVVPKRNSKLLANKINEVIEFDSKTKSVIVNNAIQRVENEFSIEKQVSKFINFYER